ncbi:hypothetical protein ACT4UM_30530, partial [Bacillus sp. SS-TM]
FGSAQPALQAAMLTIVDPSKRGVANASFFTAFDLGIGLGAILLGVVSQMFGYRILFSGSAISALEKEKSLNEALYSFHYTLLSHNLFNRLWRSTRLRKTIDFINLRL